ncbi:DUF6660 family protein [Flavobacterium suaedae]|uniref:DUF6660 family protein n=1 Tax=Flavobacterium suaedae TaxID=1767027 RepID=UPI0035715A11
MQKTRQIFIKFLSVYLLVLMILPCSDAHASLGNTNSVQLSQQADDEHHDMEICTPFCVCSSCVVGVVLQPVTEFCIFIPEIPSALISNFYQSVKSDFHGSIWQPPQLV